MNKPTGVYCMAASKAILSDVELTLMIVIYWARSVADLQRYKWYIGTGPTFQNENLGAYLSYNIN